MQKPLIGITAGVLTVIGTAVVALTYVGNDGNNSISGTALDDTILGNAGNDSLTAGASIFIPLIAGPMVAAYGVPSTGILAAALMLAIHGLARAPRDLTLHQYDDALRRRISGATRRPRRNPRRSTSDRGRRSASAAAAAHPAWRAAPRA